MAPPMLVHPLTVATHHWFGMRRAEQRPAWQMQPPPQSMVFGMQRCVHIMPRHWGSSERGTQRSAWHQTAGTQSESLEHAALVTADAVGAAVVGAGAALVASGDGRAQPAMTRNAA